MLRLASVKMISTQTVDVFLWDLIVLLYLSILVCAYQIDLYNFLRSLCLIRDSWLFWSHFDVNSTFLCYRRTTFSLTSLWEIMMVGVFATNGRSVSVCLNVISFNILKCCGKLLHVDNVGIFKLVVILLLLVLLSFFTWLGRIISITMCLYRFHNCVVSLFSIS